MNELEVRQKQSTDLKVFDAKRSAMEIHSLSGAAQLALKIKDTEAYETAVRRKLEAQRDWSIDYKSVFRHGVRKRDRVKNHDLSDPTDHDAVLTLSAEEYCRQYGFSFSTVGKWYKQLTTDAGFQVAFHKAMAKAWAAAEMDPKTETAEMGGIALSSSFQEWYTPAEWIEAVKSVLGGIDLDPASNANANKVVGASKYYTKEDNGLSKKWSGRVYINPPYDQDLVKAFSEKLVDEYENGDVTEGVFLVHHATDTNWWQYLATKANAISLPDGRINFIDGRTLKVEPGSSIRGQSIFYLGENEQKFISWFKQFGIVVKVV